jgi:hypothetical protein
MTLVHLTRETVTRPQRCGVANWRHRCVERRQAREDGDRAKWLINRLYDGMALAGLTVDTTSCAGLPGSRTPQVTSVTLGPCSRLSVQPLAGQVLGDYQEVAGRLAAALHVDRVRLSQRPNGLIRCELIKVDPLRVPVDMPPPLSSVFDQLVFGRCESGELLSASLVDIAHVVAQGMTRSGKSRWVYSVLAQVAGCPDLVVAGSDNTGILLRPFVDTRHAEYQALGSDHLDHHVELFEGLVETMQLRVSAIPRRVDVLPITSDLPVILVVVEEYGVLVDLLGAHDTKEKTKLQPRFRAAVRSLLAGGAKVGIRVLLITQRADASGPSGLGGFERGQAAVRLSFRVDTHDAARMLHPAITKESAEEHAAAPAGIALVSVPELPLARLRSPMMADYGTYADLVADSGVSVVGQRQT